jgi:HNH endonuclease
MKRLRVHREACSSALWAELLVEYGSRCACCGSGEDLVPDHIRPVSWGGEGIRENLQVLCRRCNSRKSNYFERDYRKEPMTADELRLLWNGRLPVVCCVCGGPRCRTSASKCRVCYERQPDARSALEATP